MPRPPPWRRSGRRRYGRAPSASSAGATWRQRSVASGQRPAKTQPSIALASGSAPGRGSRRACVARACRARSRASAPRRAGPACRDAAGERNSSATGASSTLRPAYITITRSAISATTPRSWVISMIAAPTRRFRSRIRSRICAWIVTSSAVVGSSAISSFGLQASAIAIITRWRMPPESWCGYSRTPARRLRDADQRQHLDRARLGGLARRGPDAAAASRRSGGRPSAPG